MNYQNTLSFAEAQDNKDSLKDFKAKFYIPKRNGKEVIYFCGNSLGLQPKAVVDELNIELKSWKENGVEAHFSGPRPWVNYHKYTKASLARLIGSDPLEVVSMSTLTSNLHFLLASFYQPTKKRVKIIIEGGAFPSDHFAVTSHMQRMGIDPGQHLIILEPQSGQTFDTEEILQAIRSQRDQLALILFPGVQYYTGQFFDLKAISHVAHEVGAYAGFDLAHAIGNLPMNLHNDEVDFATWCSYKYLNSGPGGISGIYIHERHCTDPNFPKLTGWWGHDSATRFKMGTQFIPNPGVDAWMHSNVNVLSSAVHLAALRIFDETSIHELRKKSIALTGYLEFLLTNDPEINKGLTILTPANPLERGCQLSIYINENGKPIFDQLLKRGVMADWREPNVIRVAPAPLYNSFQEVYQFYQVLKKQMNSKNA